jgi:carbamoyltransferase
MRSESPAAVHVDGTARPQLVNETINPSMAKILRAYHQKTGIPTVINTSFNMHEEPIVCSPDDAIRAFLQGNLDYLAIGTFLVPHPSGRQ